jgi:hypothetical protein
VGTAATGRPPRHPARGRPNWWVILAVSLALMALLAATSAGSRNSGQIPTTAQTPRTSHRVTEPRTTHGPTTTTVPATAAVTALGADGPSATTTTVPLASAPSPTRTSGTSPGAVSTTTSTSVTTTTVASTSTSGQAAADRTTNQGYLQPPTNASNTYGFTGDGPTEISVTWSGDTYLSLVVTCPDANQSVGGSSAMAASLPDAEGLCQATVSEPTSEDTTLAYTITIGPGNGT